MQCDCGKMVLDGLYDERLYLSTAMMSRTKVGDMSIFCFQSNVCPSVCRAAGRAKREVIR